MALSTWVIPAPKKTLVVGVADMAATNDPNAELATYSLGSCLGIALYDPGSKIGGLLHVMLPDSAIDREKAITAPLMFVDSGLPRLFRAVYSLGADRSRLVVKVAGGAQFLDDNGIFNIGERNQQVLVELLQRNNYRLHASDCGGRASRTVRLDMATGRLSVKSPGSELYFL